MLQMYKKNVIGSGHNAKKNEVSRAITSFFSLCLRFSAIFSLFADLSCHFFKIDTAPVGPVAGVAQGKAQWHALAVAQMTQLAFAARTLAPRPCHGAAYGGGAVGQGGGGAGAEELQTVDGKVGCGSGSRLTDVCFHGCLVFLC